MATLTPVKDIENAGGKRGPTITPVDGGQAVPYGGDYENLAAQQALALGQGVEDLQRGVFTHDPGIDSFTGAPASVRAGFSRMDTAQEKAGWLDRNAGEGNWFLDAKGKLILRPEGAKAFGMDVATNVAFDEDHATWRDIADFAGEGPAIAGSLLAAGATGFLPALGYAALGGAGFHGIDQAIESLQGYQMESPGEVATDLTQEAGLSAVGEGAAQALRPLGSWLLGPQRRRMEANPRRGRVMKEADELGVKLKPGQITGSPLLLRAQSMFKSLFGDIHERANAEALHAEIARLKKLAGKKMLRADLGQMIKDNIVEASKKFKKDSALQYALVDDLTGGEPIVSMASLKAVAQEMLDEIPTTQKRVVKGEIPYIEGKRGKRIRQPGKQKDKVVGGRPVFTDAEVLQDLRDVLEFPDMMTTKDVAAIRAVLFDQAYEPSLAPGLKSGQAWRLHKAATETLDSLKITNPEAALALDEARDFYKRGMEKFDDYLIAKITLEPRKAGSVDPELILDTVWRRQNPSKLARIMRIIPDEVAGPLRREAMDDILVKIVKDKDPFTSVFDGKSLRKALDSYGQESVKAMFGAEATRDLYRLARVAEASVIEKQTGLVAAAIALHPVKNLGKLARLSIVHQLMAREGPRKWLTKGLEAKTFREGSKFIFRAIDQAMLHANIKSKEHGMSDGS